MDTCEMAPSDDDPSDNLFEAVFARAPIGMALVNPDGKLARVNEALCSMLGYKASELTSLSLEEFTHADDLSLDVNLYGELIRGERSHYTTRQRYLRRDGTICSTGLSVSRVTGKSGEQFGLKMVVDLTAEVEVAEAAERHNQELQELTKQLARSTRDLRAVLYACSHDLLAPLHDLNNISSWVREDMVKRANTDDLVNLDMLNRRIGRMGDLVRGLQDMSVVTFRMGHSEEICVQDLLLEVENLARPLDSRPTLQVIEADSVIGQRLPLQQTLTALVRNAYVHGGGEVMITVTEGAAGWSFTVQDRGKGIPTIYLERVQQAFQTLRPRDECEGAGLGLAVARRHVEDAGGSLDLRPGPEGIGLAASVYWPKHDPGVAAA